MKKELTVIDFFCWAGWFSEWFRQQWFKIVKWIDYWKPAIYTHNLNHNLNDTTKSILDFWTEDSSDILEIEKLEDTFCIVGSPPCVSFSSSNKSWYADKSHWIKLIEAFLRVIAVKKHKKNSKLKCWYMENVPNSQKFVEVEYSFDKLNLWKWAKNNWKNPEDIALKVRDNWDILDSWDYWAPQSRKRFICWEWCETWDFLLPQKTHENKHITLGDILAKLPKPNLSKKEVFEKKYIDPNYANLIIDGDKLTDHFYDTWLYKIEWYDAKYLKQNHSYMWKMSFPENIDRPCRTIMATRSAKTRESLVFKSEYERIGNWEYRLPTIREIASLMWFPINYQFTGSEWSKWRQIWNAVSPHLSSALAKVVRKKLKLKQINPNFEDLGDLYEKVEIKLNTFEMSPLDKPKKRMKNSKFRRHPYKSWNITVELMNYIEENKNDIPWKNWYIKMYFWTGIEHKVQVITRNDYLFIEKYLEKNIKEFKKFKIDFERNFSTIFWITKEEFQSRYEEDLHLVEKRNPLLIVEEVGYLIQKRKEKDDVVNIEIVEKNEIPLWQLYAIYSLGKFIF